MCILETRGAQYYSKIKMTCNLSVAESEALLTKLNFYYIYSYAFPMEVARLLEILKRKKKSVYTALF